MEIWIQFDRQCNCCEKNIDGRILAFHYYSSCIFLCLDCLIDAMENLKSSIEDDVQSNVVNFIGLEKS